jgi:hypothetical protein
LAAELVGEVCKLGLVGDGMLVSVDDAPLPETPFPACVPVTADDPASVVTPSFIPEELTVPIALLEVAAESFAPAPQFSPKLPI